MDRIINYSSFDVFDTCLVRKCGNSHNLFDILAEQAFEGPVNTFTKTSFVAARIAADKKSYSAYQTLNDIYNSFSYKHPLLKNLQELMELELSLEQEMSSSVTSLKTLVNQKRNKGDKIIFISDMYLREEFVRKLLKDNDFWKDGDSIFVSCEHNARKSDGSLFRLIKDNLNISYKHWHHYGDNFISDVKVPRKLGIHAHHIEHGYLPYEKDMLSICQPNFQWGGILAGISRSLRLEDSIEHSHKNTYLDIVLPTLVSFVIRVMNDAISEHISALFFCARDSYPLYCIAKRLASRYPSLRVEYLYISRTALYDGDDKNKIGYYKKIGLASNTVKNAIVDLRSSGKTLHYLNKLLSSNGFIEVRGYLFELCNNELSIEDMYAEIIDSYITEMNGPLKRLANHWVLYELFFPLNNQYKTIGYKDVPEKGFIPILDNKDDKEYVLHNLEFWLKWREEAQDKFLDLYSKTGLIEHTDCLFSQIVLPILSRFLTRPEKQYLGVFQEFYSVSDGGHIHPFVDGSMFRLPLNILRKRTVWKRGTIAYSLPRWLFRMVIN